MIYPITYPTALDYWRHCSNRNKDFNYVNNILLTSENDLNDRDFFLDTIRKFSVKNELVNPIHIMTGSENRRNKGNTFSCHLASTGIPKKSIIELPGPVYIISPELCFLYAAKDLSFPELVKTGYDLCAIYAADPSAEYLQRSRLPVTNTDNIRMFLDSAYKIKGMALARKAIKYVLNESNSPMETKIAFIAILPFSMGGYNLPYPLMNPKLTLSPEGVRHLGLDTCRGDIVWQSARLILEYDSNMTHLSKEQHSIDQKRITAMTLSDYKVISVTADQFHRLHDIDDFYISLRKALKLRTRLELLDRYKDIRWQMLRQVFHSDFKPIETYMPDIYSIPDNIL